ncbi:MAG TPA: hypothetical protein VHZ31_06800 [Solirubrobacteraceae bacterium]|jgi:hypothetical protein|nr:hypothetical protein [Solirubrobacteraceae bacterium]
MTAPPHVVLLSMFTGPCEILRPVTLPALHEYAAAHGHAVELVEPVAGLHPSWGKVRALAEALDRYDVAVWVDADAMLINRGDIAEVVAAPAWQALGWDDRFGAYACVWALRASLAAREFLREVWSLRHGDFPDWEQGAIARLLGAGAPTQRLVVEQWQGQSEAWAIHSGYQGGSMPQRADALRARLADRQAATNVVLARPSIERQ